MFISRLEMNGFKSFAGKTALDFRPGVMAVVGPNGCGKTNIVDAVRWVLGEQRTGALRAERMESVIFNGTAKRRPIGMAEVTLTVENDRGVLPSAYTQVEITRRLFRSGESEYLINRTASRLRDIQDLFIDTGFGHSTYSIIELAMVEGIISGPSESRRALFEEAAGVAKFKSRRNSAERRLESTREALDRIKDIYGEVEKSYQTLKRQSSRAKRCQTLTRALQLRLLADLARERLEIVSRRLPTETRLVELEKSLQNAEEEASRFSTELLTLEAAEINIDGKIGRAQETLKRVERREAELDGELALLKQRSRQLDVEIEANIKRKNELIALIESSTRREQESNAEIGALTGAIKELESERQQLATLQAGITENLTRARNEFGQIQLREAELQRKFSTESAISQRAEEERSRIEASLKSALQRNDDLVKRISEFKAGQNTGETAVKSAEKALANAQARLDTTRQTLEAIRSNHKEAQTKFINARTDAETANRNLTAHQSRGVFLKGLPKTLQSGKFGANPITIAARIHSLPEHRAALAAALRPILEAIDAADLQQAVDAAATLQKGEAASLRIKETPRPTLHRRNHPDNLIPLSSLIEGNSPFDDFLRDRLSDAFLVSERQQLLSNFDWAVKEQARLVTSAGEILEFDGVLHAGTIDPEGYRVGWQRHLKELEKIAARTQDQLQTATDQVKTSETALTGAEREFHLSRDSLQKCEDDSVQTRRHLDSITAEFLQAERRLKETSEEILRLNLAIDSLPAINRDDKQALLSLSTEIETIALAKKEASNNLQIIESDQQKTNTTITANAAEMARSIERLNQTKAQSASLSTTVANSAQQLAGLEAKKAQLDEDRRRSHQAAENLDSQLALIRREKEDFTKSLESARGEKNLTLNRKQIVNQTLKQSRDSVRKFTEERGVLELEAVSGRERLKEIDRRLLEDASTQPESIVPETPSRAEEELRTLELLEISSEKIKVRIQSLGPVNMLALEELGQVEERYRFLTDQRKDLESGIELLTETIDRINHEARRRFRETFDQVDTNFQQLFRTLFEGGEARITLEGGDPLESDIRIWATPTGKKLQGLSMLSGGEKALTAISLLFAIYMVRPSPFCILDEVDAPLDDVNVGRFNRLIREFSVNTQFMIVTHNKRSMESADSLFGVTLAEDGASQLVSVRLEAG